MAIRRTQQQKSSQDQDFVSAVKVEMDDESKSESKSTNPQQQRFGTHERVCSDDNNNKEQLVKRTKREFHNGRTVHVKHLPHDATDQDVRDLLNFLEIKEVQINKRTHTGRVVLETPEVLETWTNDMSFSMQDQPVKVYPSPTEHMLCVAHLPFIFTDEEFQNLAQMYGPVAKCFLMRSERTGSFKGYGFVEYTTKEVAHQARNLLEWKQLGDCTLHCDWLDPSLVTYSSLHSKCLFVDHLPSDFRDVAELREIFSTVVKPIYCQLVMKKGHPMGIGLVEFGSALEAEETQQKLNGHQINTNKIRVSFCIPGLHAVTIFNKIALDDPANGKKPLLPDPGINPALFSQLQVLAMQNPQFFHSLQSLVANQLQNMQNNNQVPTNNPAKNDNNKLNKPGLLGNPPPLSSNPNLQAAMVILLAAQMQMQMRVQQPSLLGNPQLLNTLQTIIKQHTGGVNSTNLGIPNGTLSTLFGQQQQQVNELGNSHHTPDGFSAPVPNLPNQGLNRCNGFPQQLPAVGNILHPQHNGANNNMHSQQPPQLLSHHMGGFQGSVTGPVIPRSNELGPNKGGLLPTPTDLPGQFANSRPSGISMPQNGQTKQWANWDSGSDRGRNDDAMTMPYRETNSTSKLFEFGAANNKPCWNDSQYQPRNGVYQKTPLLGDRPNGYENVPPTMKRPLLGDRPISSGNSISPASSLSSLVGDHIETSLSAPPSMSTSLNNGSNLNPYSTNGPSNDRYGGSLTTSSANGYAKPSLVGSSFQNNQASNSANTWFSGSTMLNQNSRSNCNNPPLGSNEHGSDVRQCEQLDSLLGPFQSQLGMDFTGNLNQLNSQLEQLGSNPLIGLLLQAAQKRVGIINSFSSSSTQNSTPQDCNAFNSSELNNNVMGCPGSNTPPFSNPTNGQAQSPDFMNSPPKQQQQQQSGLMNQPQLQHSPIPQGRLLQPPPTQQPLGVTGKPSLLGMPPILPAASDASNANGTGFHTSQRPVGSAINVFQQKGSIQLPGFPRFDFPPPSLGNTTPMNHKRKLHTLLPSPEQSPEGPYIGQHSQGIGGHYADSYFKKLRK